MSKRKNGRERSGQSLQRQRPTRAPNQRILIVTEGEKTEVNYFQAIRREQRLPNTDVVIVPSDHGTDPLSVVSYAEYRCNASRTFEVVFAVFDRDEHQNYNNALAKAASLDMKLRTKEKNPISFQAIPSVPCFELWLLLHFQDVFAPYHRVEVIERLKLYFPAYEKGMQTIWQETSQRWEAAAKRAQKLRTDFSCHNGADPYTDIDKVVTVLANINRQGG